MTELLNHNHINFKGNNNNDDGDNSSKAGAIIVREPGKILGDRRMGNGEIV